MPGGLAATMGWTEEQIGEGGTNEGFVSGLGDDRKGWNRQWWEGEGAQSPEYSLCLIVLCLPSLSSGGLAWDSTSTGRGKRMPEIPQGAGAWY